MSKLILEHLHGAALRPKPTDMALAQWPPSTCVLLKIADKDRKRKPIWPFDSKRQAARREGNRLVLVKQLRLGLGGFKVGTNSNGWSVFRKSNSTYAE